MNRTFPTSFGELCFKNVQGNDNYFKWVFEIRTTDSRCWQATDLPTVPQTNGSILLADHQGHFYLFLVFSKSIAIWHQINVSNYPVPGFKHSTSQS